MSSLRLALKQSLAETGHLGVQQKDKDRRKKEKRDKQRKTETRKVAEGNSRASGSDLEGSVRGFSQIDILKRVVLPSDIAFATNCGGGNRSSESSAGSSTGTESDNDTSCSVGHTHLSPQNDSPSSGHSDHDTDSMEDDSQSSEPELEMDGVFDSEVSDEEGKDTRPRGRERHGSRDNAKVTSTKVRSRDRQGSNADLAGQTEGRRKMKNIRSNSPKKGGTGSSSKVQTVQPPSLVLIEWMRSMPTGRQRRKINSGLRVKVRFVTKSKKKQDKKCAKWYGGVVTAVASGGKRIRIKYDDGTWEDADFPDKDIVVDCEGNGRHRGQADSFHPPPISSVDGNSSLPTQGKCTGDSDDGEGDTEDSCDLEMRLKSNALSSLGDGARKREGHLKSAPGSDSFLEHENHRPNPKQPPLMQPSQTAEDFEQSVSSPHGADSRESPASVTLSSGSAQGLVSGMSTPTSSFDSGSNVSCQKVSPSSPSHKLVETGSSQIPESAETSPKTLMDCGTIVDRDVKRGKGKEESKTVGEESKPSHCRSEASTKLERCSGGTLNGHKSLEKEKKRKWQNGLGHKKPANAVPAVSLVVSDGNDPRLISVGSGSKLMVPKLDEDAVSTVVSEEGNAWAEGASVEHISSSDSKKRAFALVSDPETEIASARSVSSGSVATSAPGEKGRVANVKGSGTKKSEAANKSAAVLSGDDVVPSMSKLALGHSKCAAELKQLKSSDTRLRTSKAKGNETAEKSASNGRSSPVPSSNVILASAKPLKGKKRSREGKERCNSPTPRRAEYGKGSQDGTVDSKVFLGRGSSSSESRSEGRSDSGPSSFERNKSEKGGGEDNESRDPTFGRLSPVASAAVEPPQSSSVPGAASVDSSNESSISSKASNSMQSRLERPGGRKKAKLRRLDGEPVDHQQKHKRKRERHHSKALQHEADEEDETADEDEDVEEEEDKWVQCDRCEKWRRLPDHVNILGLPHRWYCELNHYDPARNSCEDPEQTQQEPAKEKKARRKRSRKAVSMAKPSASGSSGVVILNKRGSTGSEGSRGTALDSAEESEGDLAKQFRAHPFRAETTEQHGGTTTSLGSVDMAAAVVDQDSSSVGDVESLEDVEGAARGTPEALQNTPNLDDGENILDAIDEDLPTLQGNRFRNSSKGRNRQRAKDSDVEKRLGKSSKNDAKESESVQWVQCEKCEKWRRLPPNISPKDLPETWYCSLNTWDISTASCDAQEDEADRNVRDYTIMSGGVRISSSSNNSSKLSYRNLIFGSGRKHQRPVSERTRAAESLFPSPQTEQSIDAGVPPTVLYAGSSAFVYKGFNGHRASMNHQESVSFLDLMSNSTLWDELYRGAVAIQAISRASVTDGQRNDETMKKRVCTTLGTEPLSANEIFLEVTRSLQRDGVPVPSTCTLDRILDELVSDGVIAEIHDETMTIRYKRSNKAAGNSGLTVNKLVEANRSRCMKMFKPWKRARSGVETS